jgi:hypothetical protein
MSSQIVKFVEVITNKSAAGSSYKLQEVFINPTHIVYIRNEPHIKSLLMTEGSGLGLDPRQEYSVIHLSRGSAGLDITVVGNVGSINEKIQKTASELLLG